MLIVTISNWKQKVKIFLLVVLLLLIAGMVFGIMNVGEHQETGTADDRDSHGSMKVEATSEAELQEIDQEPVGNWFGGFVETLKGYYQD